jgi:N-acetylglucosaminyldiphosphoundecaprenol N-acetyl-beta-D-mannosaminyltransferase
MGAPLQETWIRQHFELLDCSLMLGVGGLFDYNADQVPRAPKVFRVLGIEWVWRLFKEPGRMWKRYIIGNPLFVYRIFRHGKNRPSTGTAGGKNT